jgi:hypothetical protein
VKDVIDAIKALPRTRQFACDGCGATIRAHTLRMYADGPGCGANAGPEDGPVWRRERAREPV